tara:strand:- start:3886 stop:4269 length:384 start_codon:yes stop_codon:yes gene_type:complete
MPFQTLQFTFSNSLDASIQIGDMVYWTPTVTPGTTLDAFSQANIGTVVEIGPITNISSGVAGNTVDVYHNMAFQAPQNPTDYIFFVKDPRANNSSLLGYYAKARFENDSKIEAELFAVSSEVFESSR